MIDPRYVDHQNSQDNSLVIDNGVRPSPYGNFKFQDIPEENRVQKGHYLDDRMHDAPFGKKKVTVNDNMRWKDEDGEEEELMIHKVKPQ